MRRNRVLPNLATLPFLLLAFGGCDEGANIASAEVEYRTSALESAALESDESELALAPGESSAAASETPVEVPNPVVTEPETLVYEDFEALVAKLRAESPAFAEALSRPGSAKSERVYPTWEVPATRREGMRCNEPTTDSVPNRVGFVQARFDVPLATDARLVLGPEGDELAPPLPAKAKDPGSE